MISFFLLLQCVGGRRRYVYGKGSNGGRIEEWEGKINLFLKITEIRRDTEKVFKEKGGSGSEVIRDKVDRYSRYISTKDKRE